MTLDECRDNDLYYAAAKRVALADAKKKHTTIPFEDSDYARILAINPDAINDENLFE